MIRLGIGPEAPLPFRVNASWTLVGNAVYSGCQWGMLIALSKLGSTEMVGQFALAQAVAAPIMLFASAGQRSVQASDARREYAFGDYFWLRLITTAVGLVAVCIVALAWRYPYQTVVLVMVVGLSKGLEAFSGVFYGLLQQHERMDRIAKSMIIKGVLSVVVLSASVYLTGSIIIGVACLAVSWTLVLLGYDFPSGAAVLNDSLGAVSSRRASWRGSAVVQRYRDRRTLWRLAWLALPASILTIMISFSANLPRYYIEGTFGSYELGVFAAITYIQTAGITVVGGLGQAAVPRLARYYWSREKKEFQGLFLKLVGICLLIGGAGILITRLFGEELLSILYRPEYATYVDVLVLVMVAAAIGYVASLLGYTVTAARYYWSQVLLWVAVIGAVMLSCALLIPSAGLLGAALALAVGASVQAFGTLVIFVHAVRSLSAARTPTVSALSINEAPTALDL